MPRHLPSPTPRIALRRVNEEIADHLFWPKRKVTAMALMAVDNALRDLVAALEQTGMLQSTCLVVHSDNGGYPYYPAGHPGNNWPLRGEKFYYFEGGIRCPALVFAPGLLPAAAAGTELDYPLHHVDLLTTFVGLAGGRSGLAPRIQGSAAVTLLLCCTS